MPVTYRYEPDNIVVFTFSDPVTVDEWRAAIVASLADPAYTPEMRVLSDRRTATAPETVFVHQVATIVRANPELFTQHPCAILVGSSDAAAYGMARMKEILVDTIPTGRIRTFRNYHDALAWLKAQPSGPAGTVAYRGPLR
jgi:hypothetical protein